MIDDLVVGCRALAQGFEFHLAHAGRPGESLCGVQIEPTQIPANFYGVESAIEGRWCERCEHLSRRSPPSRDGTDTPGEAPCV
ncbi:MAG: hypothetical protein GC151_15025 [Betaproteobacteria bacterium]|nr:hypothetical protein [Betaproteobacteria bacterium]